MKRKEAGNIHHFGSSQYCQISLFVELVDNSLLNCLYHEKSVNIHNRESDKLSNIYAFGNTNFICIYLNIKYTQLIN